MTLDGHPGYPPFGSGPRQQPYLGSSCRAFTSPGASSPGFPAAPYAAVNHTVPGAAAQHPAWLYTAPGELPWPVAKAWWVIRPDMSHALVVRNSRASSFTATLLVGSLFGFLAVVSTVVAIRDPAVAPIEIWLVVIAPLWALTIGGCLATWSIGKKMQQRNDLIIDRRGLTLHKGLSVPWPPSIDYFMRYTHVIDTDQGLRSNIVGDTYFTQVVSLLMADGTSLRLPALDVTTTSERTSIELSQRMMHEIWAFGVMIGAVRPTPPS